MKAAAFEMAEQVEKLVKVYKNTKVDAQMLKDADVDAVILAIGSSPITIKLEGMDKLQHASAPEVLRHEVCPKRKSRCYRRRSGRTGNSGYSCDRRM